MASRFYPAIAIACSIVFIHCKNEPQSTKTEPSYLDIKGIDTTIAAGDNFFKYVNENWNKKTVIPPTEIGAGSFFDLQTKSEEDLLEVCKEAAAMKDPAPGSVEQRVGDLYSSIMDTNAIEAKGYTPLKSAFNQIDQIKSTDELISFVCSQQIDGYNLLFGFGVNPDDKNSSKNIAQFSQGGISLPDRDYYFRSDDQSKATRKAYTQYLKKIFSLIGEDSTTSTAHATSVLLLESRIAQGHFTNVELRDPQKNYNKYGASQLLKMTPGLDWNKIKSQMKIKTDSLLIGQPSFFATFDKLLHSTTVDQWKPYLKASIISGAYNSVSKAFGDAGFDFFQKTLAGRQLPQPRWKYAVNVIDSRIGDLSGQLYVKKHFDAKAKVRMTELIDNLTTTYSAHIKSLDWMSDATKTKAIEKLTAITRKIGYPDKWRTYDSLVISKSDYYQNRINTDRNAYYKAIAKIDQPVDKTEWPFSPPTVNAGYNPATNEIVFPAGILQPPFFDANADDAVNYGGIGMVIGHELTHGFDDQGRQYDKDGNLKDWWSKDDAEKFKAITAKVVAQYAKYIPVDSIHVNGELTLGENIADFGGLSIAYDAFKKTEQGKAAQKIDALTPDQRFFMSNASIWRIKMKEEMMRQIVLTDVHSPAEFRVIGPLSNFTPFYQSYGLVESNTMWKNEKDRIKIW